MSGCQVVYTLHKSVRKTFPRNPYTVTNSDHIWEMELADLSSLLKYNDKYKYLLNVTDVFSRYAWSVPLKDKTATSITTALESLFLNRKPITLQSDKGNEFVNSAVRRYLELTIQTNGAIIERFNRTLKTKMYKYFTKKHIPLFKHYW